MKHPLLLCALGLVLAACGSNTSVLVLDRLAPGGGVAGDGGAATSFRPQLDILLRMESDSTGFQPPDLMRILVNGVDRTDEVVMGGNYALLRLDPAPVGTAQFVEAFRRRGPVIDTFTWTVQAFAGPTLLSVNPQQAGEGAAVVLSGTGFDAGTLRVFFGGVEGAVTASTATTITATVPAGALPGPLFVLVGDRAAEGLVGFLPLDGGGQPVVAPADRPLVFLVAPARGGIETPVKFFGLNFDDLAFPEFNGRISSRVFGVETVNLPPAGEILSGFAVVSTETLPGAGTFLITRQSQDSNALPFTVIGP